MGLKCKKQCAHITFRAWDWLRRFLEVLKHKKETQRGQGRHEKNILNVAKTLTKQIKAHIFRGKNDWSCVSLMNLEIRKQKTKNNW